MTLTLFILISLLILLSSFLYIHLNRKKYDCKILTERLGYHDADNIFRDSNLKALEPILDLLREKASSADLHEHNRKYINAALVNLKDSFFKYDIFFTPDSQKMTELNLNEYKYIHPERIVDVILKLIDSNPSNKEEMKSYFKLNDDNFRKYIFMKTKEFIELVNKHDDRKMLFLYTEHSLVEEAKKLFEAENIKIQFAGDDINGDGTLVCYYI